MRQLGKDLAEHLWLHREEGELRSVDDRPVVRHGRRSPEARGEPLELLAADVGGDELGVRLRGLNRPGERAGHVAGPDKSYTHAGILARCGRPCQPATVYG